MASRSKTTKKTFLLLKPFSIKESLPVLVIIHYRVWINIDCKALIQINRVLIDIDRKALVQINRVLIDIDSEALVHINRVLIDIDSEALAQINRVRIDIDSKVLLNRFVPHRPTRGSEFYLD